MNQAHALLARAADAAFDTFGENAEGQRLVFRFAGKEFDVIQNTIPRESEDVAAGFVIGGGGAISVPLSTTPKGRAGILTSLGRLPHPGERGWLGADGTDGQIVKVGLVTSSHGSNLAQVELEISS
ncbi:MAG: hypothetical protein AAF236_02225 [Verrucomicrobiota bacterium]